MAESYSVRAILSASDKGFSSTLKGAMSSVQSLGSTIKSGLGFGVLTGIGQQAFSAISNSCSGLVGEAISASDSMHKLQKAMAFSGSSADEIERIAGSTGTLKTYADKTVFSLEDVMSTFGALSANGIKDADKMTEAVGNAVAVFGGGAQEFSSVGLAFSQSMAAGKMNAQDWNQILNASPQLAGGLRKELQKLNPALAKDFKGAMEDGAITAELLGKAMNNIGMQDAAKEAATSVSTWEGAMGNLEATVQSGIMGIFDSFAKSGVIGVVTSFTDKVGKGFDWLSTSIPKAIDKIKPYWEALKSSFSGVGKELGTAFGAIKDELGKLFGAFGSTESVDSFKSAMDTVAGAIKKVAEFATEHSGTIAKLIKWLPAIVLGMKGFGVAKAVTPFVAKFGSSIGALAGKGISTIAGKLFGIGKGTEDVGKKSKASNKSVLASAKAFLMIAASVLLVSVGFALMAQSSIALANSGGLAIGVMVGMVAAVVGLGAGMVVLLKTLAPMGKKLMPVATAMLALGAAVVLIAAGFALMAYTSIQLASAGGVAIGVMVGMVAVIALLAVGAALLGTALTAGAVGFIAFGAAVLLVGAGVALASAGLTLLATQLPIIAMYGTQAALSIAALGASLIVFGAGAIVGGAGAIVLGAGLVVATAGLVAFSAGMVVTAAGTVALAAALKAVASQMKTISKNAKTSEKSLKSMVKSVSAVQSGLDALGSKAKSAMKSLTNAFDNTVKKAKTAGKNVGTGFTKGMQSGLKSAVAVANTTTMQVATTLNSGRARAYNAGAYISLGFAQGMRSQLSAIQSAANAMVSAADKAIRAKAMIHSPSRLADKLGNYFGQGWVGGILDNVKDAWNAAQELVSVPQFATPNLALAYGGELNADYDYSRRAEYNITVISELDGREVGRSTAKYVEETNNRKQTRESRKRGKI